MPVPVAMSSGKAEYIAAAVACMRASNICMLIYDLSCLGSKEYNPDELTCEPSRKIVDNEAAIAMAKCNKDTEASLVYYGCSCWLRLVTTIRYIAHI